MSMSAGFVILNYNDCESVEVLVSSIREKGIDDRICIVDNCSTDDSYRRLCGMQLDSIDVISSGRNGGYAFGNNVGCRYLIKKYHVDVVFIANPDVEFDADTIRDIKKTLSEKQQYAVMSAVMHDGKDTISDRAYIFLPSYFQNLFLCFPIYNLIYRMTHRCIIDFSHKIIDVDAVQGSFFAVRATVLEDIGYLDEGTFLFYEEMCLAMRIRAFDSRLKTGILTDQFYIHNSENAKNKKNKKDVMKKYRIYMDSKIYFEKVYHHIGKIRSGLLRAAVSISCLEEKVRLLF